MAIKKNLFCFSILLLLSFLFIDNVFSQERYKRKKYNEKVTRDSIADAKEKSFKDIKHRMYNENYVIDETAYTQGSGKIYLENYMFGLNKFSFGLSDKVDLDIATITFFGEENMYALGIKGNIYSRKYFNIAVKSNFATFGSTEFSIWKNSLITTIGNLDYNITLIYNHLMIAEYNYNSTDKFNERFISFNGKFKLTDNAYFQFENFMFSTAGVFTTYGFSFQNYTWKFNLGMIHLRRDNLYTWDYYAVNFPYIAFKIPLRSKIKIIDKS